MYVLQGAKCGSVRFEPFVNGVINKETVSRQSTITDNPIEGGGSINDHVFRSPLSFQLSGTVTDGAAAIATLQQMWMKGDVLTYTGRNQINNLVIQNLQSTHDATNRKGFTFTATLKQITIGSSEDSGTESMMSDQDSAAASQASSGTSSNSRASSQTSKSSAAGLKTTVSETISVSGSTITVTAVAYGSATVTVTVAAGTNHIAPSSKTCAITVNLFNSTLNSNTWAAIKAASDAGDAANVWSVGDTKSIRINGKVGNFTFSNQSIGAFIVGFNHNSAKEGANRTHFALGKIGGKLVALCDNQYNNEQTTTGYFNMNTSRTNVGGWKDCYMRKTLLGNSGSPSSPPANSLLAALPADLRAVMKSVSKYTDNVGNATGHTAGNVTATTDWLWLFAEFEIIGSQSYANQYEQNSQKQYDYWKSGNSKVAYKHSSTGTAVWWWRRSPYFNHGYNFSRTYTDGSSYISNASWSAGVVAGFAA